MLQPKHNRPDTPLAETPEPKTIDNTYVKNSPVYNQKKITPEYKYVEADVNSLRGGKEYSKKDSTEYKKGFENGIKGNSFPSPFQKDGYNAGNLEGKEKSKKVNIYKK